MYLCFYIGERIYSFSVFTLEFCQLLLEELVHYEKADIPKQRPNTMNRYGVCTTVLGCVLQFWGVCYGFGVCATVLGCVL